MRGYSQIGDVSRVSIFCRKVEKGFVPSKYAKTITMCAKDDWRIRCGKVEV